MRHAAYAVATALTLLGCARPSAAVQAARPATPPSPFDPPARTVLAQPTVVIPLQKIGDFYFTQVLLNGRPFRFTIETGAGFFGISGRAAKALGLPIDSIEIAAGARSPVVRIDSMNVAGATFHGLTARVSERWDATNMDGIISVSVLRDVLATLDLGASRLVLEHGALPATNGRDVLAIPGRDRGQRVDVPFELGGIPGAAVLDTRSLFWITASDSLENILTLEGPPRALGTAYGPAMGNFTIEGARVAGDVRIGEFVVQRPAVIFRDRPGLVLGVPFLEQFAVTIDQRNGRIRFSRPGGSRVVTVPPQDWERNAAIAMGAESDQAEGQRRTVTSGPPPVSGQRTMGFGIAARPGARRLTIVSVVPGSSAEKVGIREGDQLLELGGTAAASMSPDVVRAAVSRGAGVKVVVSRDGRTLEFVVEPYQVP